MLIQEIADVFSILHDGTIESRTGDENRLMLKVSCIYLAERINSSFEYFYVELSNINTIELNSWPSNMNLPPVLKTGLDNIFKDELEINSVKIENEIVIVTCLQHDPDADISGGELKIACNAIQVYDQDKNVITIDELDKLCNAYWDEFKKKTEADIIANDKWYRRYD
jgi:hypothetical protein